MKPAEFRWEPMSSRQVLLMTWWTDNSSLKDSDGIIADGAIRSGKTIAMAPSFVFWAMERFNGRDFGMCGKTLESLRRNVINTLKRQLRAEGFDVKDRRHPERLVISKGMRENTFYLFGGKDEGSQDLIQGATLAGVFFDEVALMPESFVEQATARCSVDGSKLWFNCNPQGPQHWFYNGWILDHKKKNLIYLHFTMEDNMTLSEKIRKRYANQYHGVFFDRYIRGLWIAAEGLIYDMFQKDLHVLHTIPELEGPYIVSADYGIQNATVFLLWRKVRGENRWICLREWYYSGREKQRQKTVHELVKGLKDMLDGIMPERVIVDPSASALMVELRKQGFHVREADNSVSDGISDVSTMLNKCLIAFMSCCKYTIMEFGLYIWDKRAAERGEDAPVKANDHAMDAVRYFVRTMRLVRRDRL